MTGLEKLAARGGPAIGGRVPGEFAGEIGRILAVKNGFYAFEGALHVRADRAAAPGHGILAWNEPGLWRDAYEGMADDAVFFAEDVFGTQFCVHQGAIATFDPETGAFEKMAADAEEWAGAILEDYRYWSGHPVARAWQVEHGALPVGQRLVPITPFVMGGAFEAANMHALDAVAGMRLRASIAVQIRELPDGTRIGIER